jgi:hypothetical protein
MNNSLHGGKWISRFALFFIGILVLAGCQRTMKEPGAEKASSSTGSALTNNSAQHLSSAVALDWYKLQLRMILANPGRVGALNAESFAYCGIGLYEAVRTGIQHSVSLSNSLYLMPEMPQTDNNGYDLVVSANAALASLSRSLNPWLTVADMASVDSLENAYNQSASVSFDSEKFQRSQAYGRAVASAIYGWASTDHYNASNAGYVLPTTPVGVYIITPPNYHAPVNPYLSTSRPLLIEDGSFICSPPPFPYSETPGSDFYNMVKDVYDVSKVLTPDQKTMAQFWDDESAFTPPAHFMSIVVEALDQNGADLGTTAEGLAKAGIAMREAFLDIFRAKYQYLQMRPVSYIRKIWDPNWLPVIVTPSHPEYPAAHPYVTGAVMRALSYVIGFNTPVVDYTYGFRGFAPRSYATLDGVSDEAGISRRYAGVHYMPSIEIGWSAGRALGDIVGNIQLQQ